MYDSTCSLSTNEHIQTKISVRAFGARISGTKPFDPHHSKLKNFHTKLGVWGNISV